MTKPILFAKAKGLNRASEEIATDLINMQHGTAYPTDKIAFGAVKSVHVPATPTSAPNSLVTVDVDAKFDASFKGGGDDGFLYQRISLKELTPDASVPFPLPTVPFNTHDLLPLVNARLKANLSKRDIVNIAHSTMPTKVCVRAHSNSLAWLEGVAIALGADGPQLGELDNLLFYDTFTGPVVDLTGHPSEVGTGWGVPYPLTGFTLDGAGRAEAIGDAVNIGGEMRANTLVNTHAGFVVELKLEVTEVTGGSHYLQLQLLDESSHPMTFRQSIGLQISTDGNGWTMPQIYATSTDVTNNIPSPIQFDMAQPDAFTAAVGAMGLGVHSLRLEVTPGLVRMLLNGTEVARLEGIALIGMPHPMCSIYYTASNTTTSWKFDSMKVQGFDPVGVTIPKVALFNGYFVSALQNGDPYLHYMVAETAPGAAGVTYTINGQDYPANSFRDASNFAPGAVYAEWGDEGAPSLTWTAAQLAVKVANPAEVLAVNLQAYSVMYGGEMPHDLFAGYSGLKSISWHDNTAPTRLPDLTPAKDTLENLELYESNLYGPAPDLSRFSQLKYVDLDTNQMSGKLPNIVGTQVTEYYLYGNLFTDFDGSFPSTIVTIDASNNLLTEAAVDRILAAALASGSTQEGRSIFVGGGPGNAVPSADGLATIAALEAAGWNVNYNDGGF